MKYLFFLIIAVFAIASCNNAGDDSESPRNLEALRKDSAKFTTVQWLDTAYNFGAKKMGDVVNITFRCKNTGDKPLYLIDVRPSCGCTVADYTKEPVAPGREGRVDAQFDTKKSHAGDVHKSIFVTTNTAAGEGHRSLLFSGTVLADSATAK
ncbi:DUF1573 domain-containing protein [Parafilimonas sp.]|uniref:DUF1573 domain-containing protein n=1 Tax=Parafilimonas sp. TaxID=1969739 RepID=UPI0039E5734E